MVFFKGKEQIRTVDWGSSHLWDVKFEDQPGPFSEWFPAVDVEENVFTMNTLDMEFFMSTYSVPSTTTLFDIRITFLDDVYLTLQDWFVSWVNDTILNGGQYVSPLEECCRKLHIVKTNYQREIIKDSSYWVFPKGAMGYSGSSDSGTVSKQIEFLIAGSISHRYGGSGARRSQTSLRS